LARPHRDFPRAVACRADPAAHSAALAPDIGLEDNSPADTLLEDIPPADTDLDIVPDTGLERPSRARIQLSSGEQLPYPPI